MNLSFKRKIGLLVGASIVALILLTVASSLRMRSQIVEGRKGQLVTAVEAAYHIAAGFEAKAAAGTMSKEDAQKAARDAIRVARYGAEAKDYLYIFSMDGSAVMHPLKPEWDGQPMLGKVKDSKGLDIIQGEIYVLRELEGQFEKWPKNKTGALRVATDDFKKFRTNVLVKYGESYM
jgi:methyl-accepting chemotaxis protein